MSLRQAVIAKQLREKLAELKRTGEEKEQLRARREAYTAEEAEVAAALDEVDENTSDEDSKAADELAQECEQHGKELEEAEKENETKRADLQATIEKLQSELDELNNRAKDADEADKPGFSMRKKEDEKKMETRKFFGMTMQERDAFFADPEVREWLPKVRSLMAEKREITNAEVKIPTVALPILRDLTAENSKLLPKVNLRRLNGDGRQAITGTIPEPVWTEMCGALNKVGLNFNSVTVDGYKLGAYIPVCNALLDDAKLAEDILHAFGVGMGFAIDKAIAYGTGTGMPLGIVTRLTKTTAVSGRALMNWVDVSETQVHSTSKTKLSLFEDLITFSGDLKSDYTNGETFWLMNNKTKTKLMVAALSTSAAGAIVTGLGNTMPIIGGDIVTREFMPDDVIVGGYGDMYLMSERAGVQIDESKHYRFVQDETVFKVTARYDGLPVIPEAFVAIGINGATVTADAVTFPTDEANAAGA